MISRSSRCTGGSLTRQVHLGVVLDVEVAIRIRSLRVSIHVPQGLDRLGGGEPRLFRERLEGRRNVNGAVRAIAQRRDVLVQILDQEIQTAGGSRLWEPIAVGVGAHGLFEPPSESFGGRRRETSLAQQPNPGKESRSTVTEDPVLSPSADERPYTPGQIFPQIDSVDRVHGVDLLVDTVRQDGR